MLLYCVLMDLTKYCLLQEPLRLGTESKPTLPDSGRKISTDSNNVSLVFLLHRMNI